MGEFNKHSGDFNDFYTLKQHFEDKFLAIDKFFETKIQALSENIDIRFKNLDRATTDARNAMEKRLETMNEFRNSLRDEATQFLNIKEFNIQHQKVEEDIRVLRESKAVLEGKASQKSVNTATILAVISAIVAMASLIIGFFHFLVK